MDVLECRTKFKQETFNFPKINCRNKSRFNCRTRFLNFKITCPHSKTCNNQLNRECDALKFLKKNMVLSRFLRKNPSARQINNFFRSLVNEYKQKQKYRIFLMKNIKYLYRKIVSNFDLSENIYKKLSNRSETNENGSNCKNFIRTYGNLTFNSFQNLLFLLNKITSNEKFKIKVGNDQSYNLTEKSVFIDLGSGFGLPSIHTSFIYDCKSLGIEFMEERVIAANKNIETFQKNINKQKRYFKHQSNYPNIAKHKKLIEFKNGDLFEFKSFNGTHIYIYGKLFFQRHNTERNAKKLAKILNNSNFKILIINLNEKAIKKYHFKNLEFIEEFKGTAIGPHNFKFFIYAKNDA